MERRVAVAAVEDALEQNPEWIEDCLYWLGVVLTGTYAHWCDDYDGLPVDETSHEWPCACAPELINDRRGAT